MDHTSDAVIDTHLLCDDIVVHSDLFYNSNSFC